MPINSFDDYPMSFRPRIKDKSQPIYLQLVKQLREAIIVGSLKPGDKLPPQRELADYLDIHLSTVTRAYKICEEKGLICAKTGQGTFISSDVEASNILLYPETNNFAKLGTIIPPYNGNEKLVEFIKDIMNQPDIAKFLEYGSPNGTLTQRKNIAHWMETIGIAASEEQICFATGGQNALCAALFGLFKAGDRIGANSLSFPGLKAICKMFGVQLVPLPEVQGQLDCTHLEAFCRQENIKGLYFIPDQHNPTTYTMTTSERKCIGDIAKKLDLIILEDAINRMYSQSGRPSLYSFAPHNTIYIFSTSKFLSPGLRVAFLISPMKYYREISASLYNMNLLVSPLNLEIVNRIFTTELLGEIIEEKKAELVARAGIVSRCFTGKNIRGEKTCSFRWLMLPKNISGQDFEKTAQKSNVQVFAAERFVIGNAKPLNAVRLCVSAPQTRQELQKGLIAIKELLQDIRMKS
ncbi:MAG: PLP-dependent aminotransferase family protein [Acidaminococcaceae bacterium]|jgi:DNA-binding transcriptional MocR family regulator|nr:PLP-dependent aminotransferase family protein [Acidaminococcaceae bacterium]MCI2109848.1 PLP-dependent aminotransferase family protein [Acidaminococcaceae bacterium]